MTSPINTLKSELRSGVTRKSKFRIELYIPGEDTRNLSILCQSVDFPTRTITPVRIYHKGRPLLLRGETEFGGSVNMSFLENSHSDIRRMFDFWMKAVDDPELFQTSQPLAGQGKSGGLSSIVGMIKRGKREIDAVIGLGNSIKSIYKDYGALFDFQTAPNAHPKYQTNMRVWQLDSTGEPSYGYELQNAFVSGVTEGGFSQTSINESQTVGVTIAYSEVLPLQNKLSSTAGKIVGSGITDTINKGIKFLS